MSNIARSCAECRRAKLKCDRVRPICGRCRRRGTVCDGYQTEGSTIFRDENIRAQLLSERARGGTEDEASKPTDVSEGLVNNATAFKARFSWLNQQALATIPARVRLDPEAHAVDRFFANWVVYPNDVSPGYMHHLPILYEKALPDSVLNLSIRALAFADVRRTCSGGREYEVKGLQSYGAAIAGLRAVAREPTNFQADEILAALLLVDAFETMYMGRNEPLGLHDQALKYMLEVRGMEQLHSSRRFCLSRVAIYRLQARQLLLGEGNCKLHSQLLGSLNQERPDLRVMCDVAHIISLCSRADYLVHHWWQEQREIAMAQIKELLREMEALVSSIEGWTSTIDSSLKPLTLEYNMVVSLPDTVEKPPKERVPCTHFLKHHDISIAFIWTFYAAAQIVLRDNAIKVLRLAATLSQGEAQRYLDQTHWQELAIHGLSSSIIRSCPKFMGFDVARSADSLPQDSPSQASSLGRFLGVFSMIVVRKTEATSKAHKNVAEKVLAWMHMSSLSEQSEGR